MFARGALIFAVAFLLGIPSLAVAQRNTTQRNTVQQNANQELKTIRADGAKLKSLFPKKGAAQPGDWLEHNKEAGQTFDQYRASNPNRPSAKLTTFYIQPLGDYSPQAEKTVASAKELLEIFYGVPVKTLPGASLDAIPDDARRENPFTQQPQILTTHVLKDFLPPRRPSNALAVLALTSTDLWPGEGWNFVFGQADLRERVGVYSLARYGDSSGDEAEQRRFLRRTLKVAVHETGHMLGIPHCTASECGMNGSNSRDELDRNILGFCSECEQKLWWACHLDPRKRYERLAKFAHDHELADEEKLWKTSLELLKPTGGKK